MSDRDWYQVLGVDRHAPPAAVRAAYVRLAKLHHPDLAAQPGAPPHRLAEIQRAYRVLNDPERRAALDAALAERDRRHQDALNRVHRRLRGYDRRHPARPFARPRRRRWRPALMVACAAAVILPVSALLFY